VLDLVRKRVLVTGGAGFLGSWVVHRLRAEGCHAITVPRSRDSDLREEAAVRRLYEPARPEVVIHLAALVGGIGANQASPGRFFYDNLMMGALLMEYARRHGVEKFVGIGTVCCYPKHTPRKPSGTATPKRPTPRTGLRRRCCSRRDRPTGSSTGSMRSSSYR
jgi:GDP-L-fucose synthase